MKLAHVLPILSLAAPIVCRRKPETWPPGLPGDDMKHLGTDKYIRPPPGWKAPSKKEKKAREEWIAVHRSVIEALEDFMFETTRPKARDEEQLNLRMLSVQAATARAADGILTLDGPYVSWLRGFGEGLLSENCSLGIHVLICCIIFPR